MPINFGVFNICQFWKIILVSLYYYVKKFVGDQIGQKYVQIKGVSVMILQYKDLSV